MSPPYTVVVVLSKSCANDGIPNATRASFMAFRIPNRANHRWMFPLFLSSPDLTLSCRASRHSARVSIAVCCSLFIVSPYHSVGLASKSCVSHRCNSSPTQGRSNATHVSSSIPHLQISLFMLSPYHLVGFVSKS